MGINPHALRQLDAAFRRRGMRQHLQALYRRQLEPSRVVEWLRILKIPPHQDDYPVLQRGAPCPCCGSRSPDCHATWLHEERF